MRRQLIELHRKVGKATVYVTHAQLEAITMADRIVVMNKGAIQQTGSPTEVFRQPANIFVAGFVGHPTMNLLAGRIIDRGMVGVGDLILRTNANVEKAAQAVTVGLRPTDAKLGFDRAPDGALVGCLSEVEYTGADSVITLNFAGDVSLKLRTVGK